MPEDTSPGSVSQGADSLRPVVAKGDAGVVAVVRGGRPVEARRRRGPTSGRGRGHRRAVMSIGPRPRGALSAAAQPPEVPPARPQRGSSHHPRPDRPSAGLAKTSRTTQAQTWAAPRARVHCLLPLLRVASGARTGVEPALRALPPTDHRQADRGAGGVPDRGRGAGVRGGAATRCRLGPVDAGARTLAAARGRGRRTRRKAGAARRARDYPRMWLSPPERST